jgi:hypothetical protein
VGLQITYGGDQLQPRTHRPLCIIFMRLRVTKEDEDTVAHVLRYEASEPLHVLCHALLISRDDLA